MSWKEERTHVRDIRREKIEVRPQGGSRPKRKTRRWCRGVVGREHKPVCKDYNEVKHLSTRWGSESKVLVCTVCEKQLAYYFVSPWRKEKPPAPAWVTGGQTSSTSGGDANP